MNKTVVKEKSTKHLLTAFPRNAKDVAIHRRGVHHLIWSYIHWVLSNYGVKLIEQTSACESLLEEERHTY